MKNMLATLCSKPIATKAEMGKIIASILPVVSLAEFASQTARQTSQLQSMPLMRASMKLIPTLLEDICSTRTATSPPLAK